MFNLEWSTWLIVVNNHLSSLVNMTVCKLLLNLFSGCFVI